VKRRYAVIFVIAAAVALGLAVLLFMVNRPPKRAARPEPVPDPIAADPDPGRAPLPPVAPRPEGTPPVAAPPVATEPAPQRYKEYAVENPDGTSRIVRDHRGEAPPANLPKVPLTTETFSKAQEATRPAVAECAAKLPPGVGLGGHVGVVARITATGGTSQLSEPRIRMAGFADPGFEKCMNDAIARTSFATPAQGDATYEAAMSFAIPER
jgi:hypothetical protein